MMNDHSSWYSLSHSKCHSISTYTHTHTCIHGGKCHGTHTRTHSHTHTHKCIHGEKSHGTWRKVSHLIFSAMYTFVCVCVFTRIHDIHIFTHLCLYVYSSWYSKYTHTQAHTHTNTHTHKHIHTHTHMYTCMNDHTSFIMVQPIAFQVSLNLHIHTHTHMYTWRKVSWYTHTHTLSHTHTQMYTWRKESWYMEDRVTPNSSWYSLLHSKCHRMMTKKKKSVTPHSSWYSLSHSKCHLISIYVTLSLTQSK